MKIQSLNRFALKRGASFAQAVEDDSSNSVASTLSVSRTAAKPGTANKKTTRAYRRTVSFDLKKNQAAVSDLAKNKDDEHDEAEREPTTWYSELDLSQMKEANNFTIKTVRCSHVYADVVSRAYEACCQEGTKVNEEELSEQCQLWTARAGLEQFVARSAAKGKQLRRVSLNELVCNITSLDHPELSQDDLQELLRERCEELSKPARLFALHVARAQAASSD